MDKRSGQTTTRCNHGNLNIVSNKARCSIRTEGEEELQNMGNLQHRPLVNNAMHAVPYRNLKGDQVTTTDLYSDESINLYYAREKLRENFSNISREYNTLPVSKKGIENTTTNLRYLCRDENEHKCDIKTKTDAALTSPYLSKDGRIRVQKNFNGFLIEKDRLKLNENVTSSTLRSFENEVEKSSGINHIIER